MIVIHIMWFLQSSAKKRECKNAYLGETKTMLKFCLADHCGYVRNQTLDKATGEHFSAAFQTTFCQTSQVSILNCH